MKLTFSVDGGETVTLDVPSGVNIWITPEGGDAPIGSLYVPPTGSKIGLGRYSETLAWWDYENPLPLR